MTQARLKFWGWGRESEQLSGAEIAQLEKVYAGPERRSRRPCGVAGSC